MRSRTPTTVLLAVILLATACGAVPPRDQVIDTLGTNADVGTMLLRNVRVERPEGGAYRAGDDARVHLTLINTADHADRLVRVTTTHAGGVQPHWDKECDGNAEPVDEISVLPNGTVRYPPGADPVGHVPYFLELTDIDREILAGTTVPLTFTFAGAGPETVDAMVQSHPREEVDGLVACTGEELTAAPEAEGRAGSALRFPGWVDK